MTVDDGHLSVKDAKTTLTQTGADAFANFYEAGQELDPLSFSATLSGAQGDGPGEGKDSEKSAIAAQPEMVTKTVYQGPGCNQANLAHTGAVNPGGIVAAGVGLLVLGTGVVLCVRRRTQG